MVIRAQLFSTTMIDSSCSTVAKGCKDYCLIMGKKSSCCYTLNIFSNIFSLFSFKSSKVEHYFTTSSNWSNFSGLSSLLMARYDAGIKDFSITGLNSEDVIKECIRFDTKLKRVKFHFDSKSEETFCFERLSIRPVVIDLDGNNSSVVYLAEIASQKGGISLEKCFQFRVPRKMVSDLENGNPVTLENGQTVFPSDVCNPDQPEKRLIIFEPKSVDIFQHLEKRVDVTDFLHK